MVTSWLTSPGAGSMQVAAQQRVTGWQTDPQPYLDIMDGTTESHLLFGALTTGSYEVNIDANGSVTVSPANS